MFWTGREEGRVRNTTDFLTGKWNLNPVWNVVHFNKNLFLQFPNKQRIFKTSANLISLEFRGELRVEFLKVRCQSRNKSPSCKHCGVVGGASGADGGQNIAKQKKKANIWWHQLKFDLIRWYCDGISVFWRLSEVKHKPSQYVVFMACYDFFYTLHQITCNNLPYYQLGTWFSHFEPLFPRFIGNKAPPPDLWPYKTSGLLQPLVGPLTGRHHYHPPDDCALGGWRDAGRWVIWLVQN